MEERSKRRKGSSFLCMVLAVLFCLMLPVSAQKQNTDKQNTDEHRYPVQAPRELSRKEIRACLKELSDQYPEFLEIYNHLERYPEKLLMALCNNPEMIEFVKGYPEAEGKVSGGLMEEDLREKVPLLLQWDTRWGYVPYGDDIIALSGCAPACLSMVLIALTGNEKATPDVLAAEAQEGGYYTEGVGTSWTFLTEGCERYGVTGEELILDEDKIFSELQKGNLIICSMRPGDFTASGHFIVLTGTDGERLRIHDPNCRKRSSRSWDFEVLKPQIKNLWVYAKTESVTDQMSLEEKVAQMFIVLPETLGNEDKVTSAGEIMEAINEVPAGGLIFMEQNLESESQIREMMENLQIYSMNRIGLPLFICVDEEGGTVARISGRFNVPRIGNMCDIGASGDVNEALETGRIMGRYLADLGFNVDFAPVADVLTNPDNEIVKYRSFGEDPQLVAEMSMAVVHGLQESGVWGCLKHFPGHGATEGDTHEGLAYTDKTLEELRRCELIPFKEGAVQGVDFIMAGHISLPEILGENTPASLSHTVITDILREELKYDGLVVTDALNMGAVSRTCSSASAAVQAVLAGNDLILMPEDFEEAYHGVLEAVRDGRISEERIDESVRRIVKVKQKIMS